MTILNNGSRVMKKLLKKILKKQNKRFSTEYLQHMKVTGKKWKTINETLNRSKLGSNVTSIFNHNDITLSIAKDIENTFNVYFANIGKNLASEIEQNVNVIVDYTQYVSTPLTETKHQFKCITDNDNQKAIDRLEFWARRNFK